MDKPNTLSSKVNYGFANSSFNLAENFTIDEVTGEIKVKQPLDYEKLDPTLQGKIVLQVVAHDSGDPRQESVVNVTIDVEVCHTIQIKLIEREMCDDEMIRIENKLKALMTITQSLTENSLGHSCTTMHTSTLVLLLKLFFSILVKLFQRT